jgi:hypothetical protein
MMNMEEELQRKIEAGELAQENDPDIRAYQHVFRSLQHEPHVNLRPDFTDRIVKQVVAKNKRAAVRDLVWLGAGIFFLVVGLIVAVLITGFIPDLGFLKNMSGYTGLFIFAAAFLGVLNWLDKKVVLHRNNNHPLF